MDLSIVIPVYNEEKIIEKSLKKLLEFLKTNYPNSFEVIIVNDGSGDQTVDIIYTFLKLPQVSLISYNPNRGKGYALKQGVAKAQGKYIYIADADFATPVEEINNFMKLINEYDCVIGSRAAKGAKEKSSKLRVLAGKFGNLLINLLLDLDIKDTQCGFKMFNQKLKTLFVECKTNGFGYDFEFLMKVHKAGFSIKEMPVKWIAGTKSSVGLKSYIKTLRELVKIWWKEVGLSKEFFKGFYRNTRTFRIYLFVGIFTNLLNLFIFFTLLHTDVINDGNFLNYIIPHYIIIESVAYTLSVIFNFVLHKFFTFKSAAWRLYELLRYILLLIINYLAGIFLLYIMIDMLKFTEGVAKVVSLILVISWNFFALKYFVYRTK